MLTDLVLTKVCEPLGPEETQAAITWYDQLDPSSDQKTVLTVLDILKRWGCGEYDRDKRVMSSEGYDDSELHKANNYYTALAVVPPITQDPNPKGLDFLLLTNQNVSEKRSFPGNVDYLITKLSSLGSVSVETEPSEYLGARLGAEEDRVYIRLKPKTGRAITFTIQYDISDERDWIKPDGRDFLPLFRIGDSARDD